MIACLVLILARIFVRILARIFAQMWGRKSNNWGSILDFASTAADNVRAKIIGVGYWTLEIEPRPFRRSAAKTQPKIIGVGYWTLEIEPRPSRRSAAKTQPNW